MIFGAMDVSKVKTKPPFMPVADYTRLLKEAAAEEMYAALKWFVTDFDKGNSSVSEYTAWVDLAKQALHKAEGRE